MIRDPALLEACRRRQTFHADPRHNAVFHCTNAPRHTTGAEISGTGPSPYRAMAPGLRKHAGSFWIPTSRHTPHTAILVESAIDALSLRILGIRCQPGTVLVSTTGTPARLPAWFKTWNLTRIRCAYDADKTGDGCAAHLAKVDPRGTRLRPHDAKGWNDILQNADDHNPPQDTDAN